MFFTANSSTQQRLLWRAGMVAGAVLAAIGATFGFAAANVSATTQVYWVNIFIGTGGDGVDYGGTMPLVTTPFGTTNWTAQTRQNRISVSSYAYGDTYI